MPQSSDPKGVDQEDRVKRFLSKEVSLSQEELNTILRESLEPGPDLDDAKTARSVALEETKTQLKVVFTHSIEKLSHTIYWYIHDTRKSNKKEKATWNSVLDEARNLKELFDIAMKNGGIEASYKERIKHRVGVSLFRRWEILTQAGFHKSSEAIELRKIFEEIWQKGLDEVAEAVRRKASLELGLGSSSASPKSSENRSRTSVSDTLQRELQERQHLPCQLPPQSSKTPRQPVERDKD